MSETMTRRKALDILELDDTVSHEEVRKRYRLKALKYHPDKKPHGDVVLFRSINEAYTFLANNQKKHDEDELSGTGGYETYMKQCLSSFGIDVSEDQLGNVMDLLQNKCITIASEKLGLDTLIRIYSFLFEMRTFIGVSDSTLRALEEVVQKKIKNENIILIHPTLRHLMDKEVYVLNYNNETWYVPLWEPEAEIECSEGKIRIRCIPDLSDNYWLDDDNTLHVNVVASLSAAFVENSICVKIEDKEYFIPSDVLRVTKRQTYVMRGVGILKPNMDHQKKEAKGDIVFHIVFSD